MIVCKSPEDIGRLRAANRLVADVLRDLQAMVAPGVTTQALDAAAEARILAVGAVPAFKGYHGYPATLCASVNEAVVHGIPSDVALKEGDIISIDMGVVLDGYFGDSALTVGVGQVSEQASTLMRVTREALDRAIAKVQIDGRVSDLGHAVQQHVEAHGFSVGTWPAVAGGYGACHRADGQRWSSRCPCTRRRVDGGDEGWRPLGSL